MVFSRTRYSGWLLFLETRFFNDIFLVICQQLVWKTEICLLRHHRPSDGAQLPWPGVECLYPTLRSHLRSESGRLGSTFHVYYTAFTYHPRSELNLDRWLAEATCPQISQQRLSRPLWCLHTVSPTKLPTSHPSFRCSYSTLNPARLSQAWPAWYLAVSESLPIQFLWFRKFPTPTHPNHQDQLKQHLLLEPYLISWQPPGWASSLL